MNQTAEGLGFEIHSNSCKINEAWLLAFALILSAVDFD